MQELTSFGELPIAGVGFHEIGEIRLRIGDLDGAEEAFAQAHQRGNDAQPGLALLQLARGRSGRGSLVDPRRSRRSADRRSTGVGCFRPRSRSRSLSHDASEAREAAEELGEIASPTTRRCGTRARTRRSEPCSTYEGDAAAAIAELRQAVHRVDRGRPAVRDGAGASMPRHGSSRRRRRGVGRPGAAGRARDVRAAGAALETRRDASS